MRLIAALGAACCAFGLCSCERPPATVSTTAFKSADVHLKDPHANVVDTAAPSAFSRAKLTLIGITIRGKHSEALLSVDSQAPFVTAVGAVILGARVVSIEPARVVIEDGSDRYEVGFTAEQITTTTTAPPAKPEAGTLASALDPDGGFPISPSRSQDSVGRGNAAFLAAIEQAGNRERSK